MDEKNSDTPIMDELFFGDFNPEEQILSKRPEYQLACRNFTERLNSLKEKLPAADYENLEEALQSQAIAETYQNLEFFKCGITIALKMMQEADIELTEIES